MHLLHLEVCFPLQQLRLQVPSSSAQEPALPSWTRLGLRQFSCPLCFQICLEPKQLQPAGSVTPLALGIGLVPSLSLQLKDMVKRQWVTAAQEPPPWLPLCCAPQVVLVLPQKQHFPCWAPVPLLVSPSGSRPGAVVSIFLPVLPAQGCRVAERSGKRLGAASERGG